MRDSEADLFGPGIKYTGILFAHARDEWNNFEFGAICLNAYALRWVFKRVIYIARKILSGEMKDYNTFTHISITEDIYNRDFGLDEDTLMIKVRTERDKGPKKWSLKFDLTKIKMFTGEDKR